MELALPATDVGLRRLAAFGLRMRVWWSRDRLTRSLAAGAASVDSRELALRAGQLTAARTREVVAASIEDLIVESDRPRRPLSSQVPVDYAKVRAAHELLVELADRLRSRRPIRPQGMALVVVLLTDVEQPLFGMGDEQDLARAIIHARHSLDP